MTNRAAYDAALCARGSLAVRFSEEAIAAWAAEPRTTPGGRPHHSALAITTALTLRAVFRPAPRRTEGLIGPILRLLGLGLAAPGRSTPSRRAETLERPRPRSGKRPARLLVDSAGPKLCGPGERLAEKRGAERRRAWKRPRLGTDADTGRIVAAELAGHGVDDGSRVGPPLGRIDGPVAARHPGAAAVVPPRASAVPSEAAGTAPTQRDAHLRCVAARGRMGWQKVPGYNWRALAEAGTARWKRAIGGGPRPRTDGRQRTEVAIAADVLDRTLDPGRPEYVRIA